MHTYLGGRDWRYNGRVSVSRIGTVYRRPAENGAVPKLLRAFIHALCGLKRPCRHGIRTVRASLFRTRLPVEHDNPKINDQNDEKL